MAADLGFQGFGNLIEVGDQRGPAFFAQHLDRPALRRFPDGGELLDLFPALRGERQLDQSATSAPSAATKPSRCIGLRFLNNVVRSIPRISLNSAMVEVPMASSAESSEPCVLRIPCRLISASKYWVTTRPTRRRLKQTQFFRTEKSSALAIDVYVHNKIARSSSEGSESPRSR
jgi:hypothetical protein